MYNLDFTDEALVQMSMLQKHAPKAMLKLRKLLAEIAEHPRTGTGQVERLKHYANETWSRRITREHRLVYEIRDEEVLVLVLSTYGHYD